MRPKKLREWTPNMVREDCYGWFERTPEKKIEKSWPKIWWFGKVVVTLQRKTAKGAMSEWLGKGLQNLLHQFESGWHLREASSQGPLLFFVAAKV